MTRRSLSQRDRRAIFLGLAVLGPSLFYVGAVRPYAAALTETRQQLVRDRDALAHERALLTFAPRSAALRHSLDSVITASRERLFGARDDGIAAAELGAYLARLARRHQVWLRAAEPREGQTSPNGVRTLPVEIQAESDFAGILAFLHAIEQGDKLLSVDQLSITAGADTSAATRVVELRATVTGYSLGDPPGASPVVPARGEVSGSRP